MSVNMLSLTGCLNYVAMGTKHTNWTIEDSLQLPRSPATSDRGNQSNEWISREVRPQAGQKIQVEQERGGEEWRARKIDRIRDRPKEGRRDVEQDQRERGRFAQFKGREDEMDLRERDRRREEGRYTNGRVAYVQQQEEHREREKGDTFPRTMRQSNEKERRTRHFVDQSSEKLKELGTGRLRELDLIEIERERAKKREKDTQRYREIERQRENERRRLREEMKRNAGGRLEEEDLGRMRLDSGKREKRGERPTEVSVSKQQILRRQENDRYRDRPRDREEQFYFPQTRRIAVGDRENLSDREERDERKRVLWKERYRYTKSEGDSDEEKEREVSRRQNEAVCPRLDGRSEMDNIKERTWDKMRERVRRKEIERQRERDRRKEKETAQRHSGREENKEHMMERYRERDIRKRDWAREEREHDRQRDRLRGNEDKRSEKEFNERMRREYERERVLTPPKEREMDMHVDRQRQNCYEEKMTGRISQTQREGDGKIKEEAQSSRERMPGSDVEGDHQERGIKESFEDKERKNASDSDVEKKRSEERKDTARGLRREEVREGFEKDETELEREKDKESKKRPYRKMWLEPRSGREKTESFQKDYEEREQARERYVQRYNKQNISGEEKEMPTESGNEGETVLLEDRLRKLDSTEEFMKDVDAEDLKERTINDEMVFDSDDRLDVPWQLEAENVADNMEGSDREEEKESDRYVNSEGEDGSEGAWDDWRDKVTSGDDGFVTVSSGAEEYETEEDKFEDCREFWDGGDRKGLARQSPTISHQNEGEIETRMTKERSDRTVTVFCVVGQTLPRSGSNQNPLSDHMEQGMTSQDSSWEMSGVGGDRDEALNRDTDAESMRVNDGPSLSEEDMSSSQDSKCDNAESDQMTKEIISSEDSVLSSNVIAEKDTEQHPTKSVETLTHIEDHGNAPIKVTDGGNQVERQNKMESSCHLEETESADNRKRISAAPHVKWAKNVLNEILDSTEDGTLIVPEPCKATKQGGNGAPAEAESQGDSPLYGIVQKPRKHNHDRKCIYPDLPHFKLEDAKTDVQVGKEILLQVEGQSEGEEELEPLSASPDLHSLSSDNEIDKEGSSMKQKKQKKKSVWNILGSNSFRELGNEVWGRRAGIRRTLQKHNEEEEEKEEVGRDRRPRVFTAGERKLDVNWDDGMF